MKKIILFAAVLLCAVFTQNIQAQSKKDLKGIESISFYGVDFTQAKVYGAEDPAEKLIDAFARINDLFEAEPKKYNPAKTFGVKESNLFNMQIRKNINGISKKALFTDNNNYIVSDNQVDNVVRKLRKEGDSQYGAVIIAGLLNKTANQGTFTYVVFEQSTNKVIFQQELSGKAKGFGLRNYWAGALYMTMKKVK